MSAMNPAPSRATLVLVMVWIEISRKDLVDDTEEERVDDRLGREPPCPAADVK
jgi:hypothetical protein